MESLLKSNELNEDNFETAISVGMRITQIEKMFNKTSKELDSWCMATYGQNLSTSYEIIRQISYREFMNVVKNLGFRGNPTALGIINDAINDMKKEQVTRIVFENGMKPETEEDAEDDGD